MAIFGRRQPHRPLVLAGIGQPSVNRAFLYYGVAVEGAASYPKATRRPVRIAGILPPGEPPAGAPVGKFLIFGQKPSQHATQLLRKLRRKPIIKPLGSPGPVGVFRIFGQRESQHAVQVTYRLRPRPFVNPAGGTSPIAKLMIFGELASQQASQIEHKLRRQPIIRHLIPPSAPQVGPLQLITWNTEGPTKSRHHERVVAEVLNSLIRHVQLRRLDVDTWKLGYVAALPGNWTGNTPQTVGEALDRLVAVVTKLNGGVGP